MKNIKVEKYIDFTIRCIEEDDVKGFTTNLIGDIRRNMRCYDLNDRDMKDATYSKLVKAFNEKGIEVIKLNKNKQILIKKGYPIQKVLNYLSKEECILYANLPNSKITYCI